MRGRWREGARGGKEGEREGGREGERECVVIRCVVLF